jgi:tripeptide aminopeptidase
MPNKIIELFLQLVRIDSITGEETKLADFLVEFLRDKVSVVKRDKFGNVYARLDGVGNPIFLSAHMDTVEPGRGIKPQIKGGYLTSDGTTILGGDNKIALAAILETFQRIKKIPGAYRTVEAIFTCSEESGNYGAIGFDYSLLQSKVGFCFDSSDPVGTIVLASPYYERFDLEIIGKEAHPSRPNEAINTVLVLKELLNRVTVGQLDRETILNLGVVQSGRVRNTIPGNLIIQGEIRSFKEENLLIHKQKLEGVLAALAVTHKVKVKSEFVRENPGYKYAPNSQAVTSLVEILKRLAISPKTKVSWGVSDANIFNEHGLVSFNLGDGTEFSHTTRERVKISQLEELADLAWGLAKI